jgi:hypothetical protein
MRRLSILLVVFVALRLCATSVIPMSVEELARASTQVVRARALSSESSWNPSHTQIFTFTRFEALENWKGAAGTEFVVRQMGGRVGNIEQKVSGVRTWKANDEAVLFLRPSEAGGGVMAIVGLFQGNFAVDRNRATASNGVPDAIAFDPATRTATHFHAARFALTELQRRVALAAGR